MLFALVVRDARAADAHGGGWYGDVWSVGEPQVRPLPSAGVAAAPRRRLDVLPARLSPGRPPS